jgi:hypothetical protein
MRATVKVNKPLFIFVASNKLVSNPKPTHSMIPQTAQAIASEKPSLISKQCRVDALANAFERLSPANGVLWPLVVRNRICEVKQMHAMGKVTSLCGYLEIGGNADNRHNLHKNHLLKSSF